MMADFKIIFILCALLYSVSSFANVTKIKMNEVDVIQVSADSGRLALEIARSNIPSDFREYKEWMSPITGCELGSSYQESKDICLNRQGENSAVFVFLPITAK